MPVLPPTRTIQIDIVSDVVCPWCFVGFRQVSSALAQTGQTATIRWHPFELNPAMEPEGENLRTHLVKKYGISEQQSVAARAQLTALGADLGIDFRFSEDMKMLNTFKAHQLLDWALEHGRQTDLKQVLFTAYFTEGQNISDSGVLEDAAARAGLDPKSAAQVLTSGDRSRQVRVQQQIWRQKGVTGVPAMVFDGTHFLTGAQGAESYAQILHQVAQERSS